MNWSCDGNKLNVRPGGYGMGIQTLAGQESYRGEDDLTSYSYSVSLLQLGGVIFFMQ